MCELLRPVVLFGRSRAECARPTGTAQRTMYRWAARFGREGMHSLFDEPKPEKHKALPAEMREAIFALKAEYPSFGPNEIATAVQIPLPS